MIGGLVAGILRDVGCAGCVKREVIFVRRSVAVDCGISFLARSTDIKWLWQLSVEGSCVEENVI